MNITNTSNSTIAHNISLDASHVSRLRRGQRNLPKKQSFLLLMSEYFARQIKEDYQKSMLLQAVKTYEDFPVDEKTAAHMIFEWLSEEKDSNEPSVESILNSFTSPVPKPEVFMQSESLQNLYTDKEYYYYGTEGKREAVIRFLSMVAEDEKPQTLLLFSDEEMSWLYHDRDYAMRWASLIRRVLVRGNRIRIIHTVNRDINEMLEAVAKWLPIYIGGAIEPYYYPKLRDGVFKRTLFIAPRTCAVVSTSVQDSFQEMVNFFVTDKKAIDSLSMEYNNYYSLCRPLMKIFNVVNYDRFWDIFEEMEKEEARCIITGPTLSLMTMPEAVAVELEKTAKNKLILKVRNKSANTFENNIKKINITEIISLPTAELVSEGAAKLPYSDMIFGRELHYTKDQFLLHLENVVTNLEKHKNYNVVLNTGRDEDLVLYGKEDSGIVVAKYGPPSAVFAMNEPNMSAAFWDYLNRLAEKAMIKDKKEVISYLKEYIIK